MLNQSLSFAGPESQTPISELDTDRPHWGLLGGVSMWVLSVALPQVLPLPYIAVEAARNRLVLPTQADLNAGNIDIKIVFISIVATAVTHLLVLAACWAVVTHFGRLPFLASLGWRWGGLSTGARALLVAGAIGAVYMINIAAHLVLPDTESTPFSEMLKASEAGRYMLASLAVLSAPFVEELIYRGMLYSGLRSRLPIGASVLVVSALFTLVHVQQYWGAWASLVMLLSLSFMLTLVRAYTKSILPCVIIHFVFNLIGATGILFGDY